MFRRRSQQLIFPSITDCTSCTGWEVNFNDLKKEGGVEQLILSCFSEMISPTMMMETEVDTDTDTIDDCEDKHNIYEEVLNNEAFRQRNNRSRLSSTSSIYRAAWWGRPSDCHSLSFQVRNVSQRFFFFFQQRIYFLLNARLAKVVLYHLDNSLVCFREFDEV